MFTTSDYFRSVLLRSTPSVMLLLAVFIAAMPMPIFNINFPFVFYTWMVIYFWSLYGATTLPFTVLFLCGLIHDIATGFPLGLNALMFMMWRFSVSASRRFIAMQQFWTIWAGFWLMGILSAIIYWLVLNALFENGAGVLLDLVISALVTAVLYPICHLICNAIYVRLPLLQLRPQ